MIYSFSDLVFVGFGAAFVALRTAALAVWFLAGVGLALWRRPAGHILLRAHVVLSLLWLVSTMLQGREFC